MPKRQNFFAKSSPIISDVLLKTYLTTIEGSISVTQSNAILRYIARKNDMCGKTEQEKVWVDMMADEAMDFRNGWVRLCYCPLMGKNFVS